MKNLQIKLLYYILTYFLCLIAALSIMPLLKFWYLVFFAITCGWGLFFSAHMQDQTKERLRFFIGIFLIIVFVFFSIKFSLDRSALPYLMLLFLLIIALSSFTVKNTFQINVVHFESLFLIVFSTCLPFAFQAGFRAMLLFICLFITVFLLQITHSKLNSEEVESGYIVTNINITRRFVLSFVLSIIIAFTAGPLIWLVPKFSISLNLDRRGSSVVDFKPAENENLRLILPVKGKGRQIAHNEIVPYVRSLFLPAGLREKIYEQGDDWKQPLYIRQKDRRLPEQEKVQSSASKLSGKDHALSQDVDQEKRQGDAVGGDSDQDDDLRMFLNKRRILKADISKKKTLYRLISSFGDIDPEQKKKLNALVGQIKAEVHELELLEKQIEQVKPAETIKKDKEYAQLKKDMASGGPWDLSLAKKRSGDKKGESTDESDGTGAGGKKQTEDPSGGSAEETDSKADGSQRGTEGTGEGQDGSGKGTGEGHDGSGKGTGEGQDGSGKGTGEGQDGSGQGTGEGQDGSGKGTGEGSHRGTQGQGESDMSGATGSSAGQASGSSAGGATGSSAGRESGSGDSAGETKGDLKGASEGGSDGQPGGSSGSNSGAEAGGSSSQSGDGIGEGGNNSNDKQNSDDESGKGTGGPSDNQKELDAEANSGKEIEEDSALSANKHAKSDLEKKPQPDQSGLSKSAPLGKFKKSGYKPKTEKAAKEKGPNAAQSEKLKKKSSPESGQQQLSPYEQNTIKKHSDNRSLEQSKPKQKAALLPEKPQEEAGLTFDKIRENKVLFYLIGFFTILFAIIFVCVILYLSFCIIRKIIRDLKMHYFCRYRPHLLIINLYHNLRLVFLKTGQKAKPYLTPKEIAEAATRSEHYFIRKEVLSITDAFVKVRYSNERIDEDDVDKCIISYNNMKNKIGENLGFLQNLFLKLNMFSLWHEAARRMSAENRKDRI